MVDGWMANPARLRLQSKTDWKVAVAEGDPTSRAAHLEKMTAENRLHTGPSLNFIKRIMKL